jgi:hypothetical protein
MRTARSRGVRCVRGFGARLIAAPQFAIQMPERSSEVGSVPYPHLNAPQLAGHTSGCG